MNEREIERLLDERLKSILLRFNNIDFLNDRTFKNEKEKEIFLNFLNFFNEQPSQKTYSSIDDTNLNYVIKFKTKSKEITKYSEIHSVDISPEDITNKVCEIIRYDKTWSTKNPFKYVTNCPNQYNTGNSANIYNYCTFSDKNGVDNGVNLVKWINYVNQTLIDFILPHLYIAILDIVYKKKERIVDLDLFDSNKLFISKEGSFSIKTFYMLENSKLLVVKKYIRLFVIKLIQRELNKFFKLAKLDDLYYIKCHNIIELRLVFKNKEILKNE